VTDALRGMERLFSMRVLERGMRVLTALLVLGAVIGGGSQDIASAQ
jgi:hypothetical protein